MTLDLRPLRGDDLFPLLGIVGKLDIVDKVMDLYAEQNGEKLTAAEQRARGVKVGGLLVKSALSNITKVREDVNLLLSDLTGAPLKTIKELGFIEYTGLVVKLFKQPEFVQVFTSAVSPETAESDD